VNSSSIGIDSSFTFSESACSKDHSEVKNVDSILGKRDRLDPKLSAEMLNSLGSNLTEKRRRHNPELNLK
jgi:hypothetical protein